MIKSIGLVLLGAALAAGVLLKLPVTCGRADTSDAIVTVDQIKEVARLATADYYISSFVEETKAMAWYEWREARFIVFLKGVLTGSVDLEQAAFELDPDGKTVAITFHPEAVTISDPQIGRGDIRFIEVSNPNLINPISEEDWQKGIDDAVGELRTLAEEAGIGRKTKDEAAALLTAFLGSLGYEATIVFLGSGEAD